MSTEDVTPQAGRRFSARHNLGLQLLALYLLFVMPVLAGALAFNSFAGERLEQDVKAADLALARAIALETDAALKNALQTVAQLAQHPDVIAVDREGMAALFADVTLARSDVSLISRLGPGGVLLYHYPTGPGSMLGLKSDFRDYFQDALRTNQPVVSKGFVSPPTRQPVATTAMAVYDESGEFIGVVATDIRLQSLSDTLATIAREHRPEEQLQVLIVDSSGRVIAHPDSSFLLKDMNPILPEVVQAVLSGHSGNLIRPLGNEETLYSYVPVPSAGWGVIVSRPTAVAFATPRAFRRVVLAAIAVFGGIGLFFWLALSRQVIRPLGQLADFSRLVGRRHGRLRPEEEAGLIPLSRRSDQLGHLTHSFITMARNIEKHFVELSTLLETSRTVVASLDVTEVIHSILEQVQRLLDVERCAIVALDEQAGEFRIRASRGLSDDYVSQLRIAPSEPSSPSMRALRSRSPVQVVDTEIDHSYREFRLRAHAEGHRSVLAIPLLTQHALPAVLLLYKSEPYRYSPSELELASSFANHAAMALENAALFSLTDEELQKQVQSLRALNQVALTVSQSLVLDDVLNNALDAVVRVMETDTGWVYLLAEGETTLRLRAHRGLSAQLVGQVTEQRVGAGLDGWVAQTGEPGLIEDASQTPPHPLPVSIEEGLRSFAVVPLRAKENVVGTLGVATRGDRRFTDDEVELLSAIGGQVGLAVENARLYRRSRQAAILDERNRVAREIHDSLAQGLIGIIVQLEAVERLAQRRPEQAVKALQRALNLARHSLQEARRSVWGLRPRTLEDQTLVEAIGNHIAAVQETGSVVLRFSTSGEERALSPDVETNLFRIAQEALNNVQRHAQAHNALVHLSFEGEQVRLVVQDDGVGLLPANLSAPTDGDGGFGLIGMQERASLLGGEMRVSSVPDEGTQVEVIVPC
jgi:signal transduction histidine kinase/HAMP domain-containing protein